jgi:integrase
MARKPTGSIREHVGKDGLTYRSLRFSAYGERRFLALGAVTQAEAERQLRGVLADVERGVWREPAPEAPEPDGIPTFHEFAELWWVRKAAELRPKTQTDYKWRLEAHLLPFFGQMPVDQITVEDVDRYKAAKLAEADELRRRIASGEDVRNEHKQRRRPCSASTINKMLVLLSAILEVAEERYEGVSRNPARGKRRRVTETKPKRTQLDTATAIAALLAAAAELDAEAQEHRQIGKRLVPRRAIITALLLSGPRIGELTQLQWADVDLANGRVQYDSKTPAGCRWVRLLPALREELVALKVDRDPEPQDFVFGTARGRKQSESNTRNRVLTKAVERANKRLAEARENPLPHLTPHGCRRTFASISYALGASPAEVMAELGHTNPSLALAVYAQAMRMSDEERSRLRALVDGRPIGTNWHSSQPISGDETGELIVQTENPR